MSKSENEFLKNIRFETLLDRSMEGVWIYNDRGITQYVNQRMAEMLGATPDDMIGQSVYQFMTAPKDLEAAKERYERRMKGLSDQSEIHLGKKDGGSLLALVSSGPIFDSNGKPNGAIAFVNDVSELRQAQESLKEKLTEDLHTSQNRLELALEQSKYAIWEADFETHKVFWSKTMLEILEFPDDFNYLQMTPEDHWAMIHQDDRKTFLDKVTDSLTSHTPLTLDVRAITYRGKIRWIHAVGKPVPNEEGRMTRLLAIVHDITVEKDALEVKAKEMVKLSRISRLSALGEMAGNIAHEINNPVTIINGLATLMLKKMSKSPLPTDEIISCVERLKDTSKRISKIVDGLRFFSRDGSSDPLEKTDLRKIVEQTIAICQKRYESLGIQVTCEYPSEPEFINCRPVQISQVVMNLLSNSFDAVGDQNRPQIDLYFSSDEEEITLHLKDNGPGVPPAVQEFIYEPFFTTKPPGKGTGLGLSICKSILEAHQARIELKKNKTEGAHFDIIFDRAT